MAAIKLASLGLVFVLICLAIVAIVEHLIRRVVSSGRHLSGGFAGVVEVGLTGDEAGGGAAEGREGEPRSSLGRGEPDPG